MAKTINLKFNLTSEEDGVSTLVANVEAQLSIASLKEVVDTIREFVKSEKALDAEQESKTGEKTPDVTPVPVSAPTDNSEPKP